MTDFDAVAFGSRIKELRKVRRMSLQEVGDAAGFTKSHVWELETGRSVNPTVRAIWSLARALGTTPGDLLGLEPGQSALDPVAVSVACLVDRALRQARVREEVTLSRSSENRNGTSHG